MEEPKQEWKKRASANDYLANERTFLAWIRTSIALMGFGFVVVKFALFIQQMSILSGRNVMVPQNQNSARIGVVMIALGAVITILSFLRYRQIEKRLQQNEFFPSRRLSALVAICIIAGSILLLYFLLPNL